MRGFFDQYPAFYQGTVHASPNRLNQRYHAIIEANRPIFPGARVLDIGAHDGRWSLAALDAGAAHVTLIEPRVHVVEAAHKHLKTYEFERDAYTVSCDDVMDRLDWIAGQRFDVVLILGFLYHTGAHLAIMEAIAASQPKSIVIDTNVVPHKQPVIRYKVEEDAGDGEAFANGGNSLVGAPSLAMIQLLLDYHRYQANAYPWAAACTDWTDLEDYKERRRMTVVGTKSASN